MEYTIPNVTRQAKVENILTFVKINTVNWSISANFDGHEIYFKNYEKNTFCVSLCLIEKNFNENRITYLKEVLIQTRAYNVIFLYSKLCYAKKCRLK